MSDNYKADGTPTHRADDETLRKSRYGLGRQPWDDIKEQGWAPHFAAGNVLKYLRRDKDRAHSIESARWYFARLVEYVNQDVPDSKHADWTNASSTYLALVELLTKEELELLRNAPPPTA